MAFTRVRALVLVATTMLAGSLCAAAPSHGSLLCQDAAESGVLGWVVTGPGSGLSEEPALGCELVALE